jgi:uncharacterized protein YecE (DUF72 family)
MTGSESPRTVTARFAYVRFHGGTGRYSGSYSEAALGDWARWLEKNAPAYVYFNNDIGGHAPRDARRLKEKLTERRGGGEGA